MSSSGDLVIDSLKFNGWDPESIFNVEDNEVNSFKPGEISDDILMDLAIVGSLPFGGEFDQDENLSQSFPSSQVFYGANHKSFLQVNHSVISTAEDDDIDETPSSPVNQKKDLSLNDTSESEYRLKLESDIVIESDSNVAFVEDSDSVTEAVFTPMVNNNNFTDSQSCEISSASKPENNNNRNTMMNDCSDEGNIEENPDTICFPGAVENYRDVNINKVQDVIEDPTTLTTYDVNTEDNLNEVERVEVDIPASSARNVCQSPPPIEPNTSSEYLPTTSPSPSPSLHKDNTGNRDKDRDRESLKEEIEENESLPPSPSHNNTSGILTDNTSDAGDAAINPVDFDIKLDDDNNNSKLDENDDDTNSESGSIDDDSIAKWEILEEEKEDKEEDDDDTDHSNSNSRSDLDDLPTSPATANHSAYKHRVTFNDDEARWSLEKGNGVVSKQISLDSIEETEEEEQEQEEEDDDEDDNEDMQPPALPLPPADGNISYNWSRGSAAVTIQRVARGHLGRRKYSRILLREERAKLRGLQAKKQLQQQLMTKTAVSPKDVLPSPDSDTIVRVLTKEKADVLPVIKPLAEEKENVGATITAVSATATAAAAATARPPPVASHDEKSRTVNGSEAEADGSGGGHQVTVVSVKDLRLKKSNGNQNQPRPFPTATSTGNTSIPRLNASAAVNPVSRKSPVGEPRESDRVAVKELQRPLSSIESRSSSGSQGEESEEGVEGEESEVLQDSLDATPSPPPPPTRSVASRLRDRTTNVPVPVPVPLASALAASESSQNAFTEKEEVVTVDRSKKDNPPPVIKTTPPPLPLPAVGAAKKAAAPVIGIKDLQQAIGIQKTGSNANANANASEPITVITGAPGRKLPMLNARRQNAALCLQRVFRGHLGRKRWLERQEKLRQVEVYRCKNCGRVERGGAYCKGCGHRKAVAGKGGTPAIAAAASDGREAVLEERKKDRIRVVQKRNLGGPGVEPDPNLSLEYQTHMQQQLPTSKNNMGAAAAANRANPKSSVGGRGLEKPPRPPLHAGVTVAGSHNVPAVSGSGRGGQRGGLAPVNEEPTERGDRDSRYGSDEPAPPQATPATRIPRPNQNPPPLPATTTSYTAPNRVAIPEDSPVRQPQPRGDSHVLTDVPVDKKLLQDIKRNRSRPAPPQNHPAVPTSAPPPPPVAEQLLPPRQPPRQDPQRYGKPASLPEDPPRRRHSNRESYTSATGSVAKAGPVAGRPMDPIERNAPVAVATPPKLSLLRSPPPVTADPPPSTPPAVALAPPPAGSYLSEYQRRRGGATKMKYQQSDASALPPILPAPAPPLSPRSQPSLQSQESERHPLDSRRQKQTVARKSTNSAPPRLTVNEPSHLPAAIRRSNDYLEAHSAAPLFPSKKNIASRGPRG